MGTQKTAIENFTAVDSASINFILLILLILFNLFILNQSATIDTYMIYTSNLQTRMVPYITKKKLKIF